MQESPDESTDQEEGNDDSGGRQGPSAALDTQHKVERWWRTPMARKFAHSFDGSMENDIQKNQHGLGATGRLRAGGGRGGNVEAMIPTQVMLKTAPSYSVTSDMVTLTEAAAAQFPGQPLFQHDLPTPRASSCSTATSRCWTCG